jgi:ABC-2 type transport system permease protein
VALAVALLGWRPTGAVSLPLALLAVALGTAAFAGLGLAMAGRLRAEATLAVANAAFVGLLLLGGVVVPLDQLPSPLAAIGSVLPAAPLAELLRVAAGAGGDGVRAAALLGAWAAAGVVLAIREFRWE